MDNKLVGYHFQLPSDDHQHDRNEKFPHISSSKSIANESNSRSPASPVLGRKRSGSRIQIKSESIESRQEIALSNNIDAEYGFSCQSLNNLLRPFEKSKEVNISSNISGKNSSQKGRKSPGVAIQSTEIDPFADIQTKASCLFFGTTICLQSSSHGYFLSTSRDVHASNSGPLANSRFKLTPSLESKDYSVIKYGDLLYIQIDKEHVIGTSYIGFENDLNAKSRVCEGKTVFPIVIKTTHVTLSKQHVSNFNAFGRWRILSKNRPYESVGEMVCNKDEVIFEQDGYYLSSYDHYKPCTCDQLDELNVSTLQLRKTIKPELYMVWRMLGVENVTENLLTQSNVLVPGVKNQKRLFQKVQHQLEHSASKNDNLLDSALDNLNQFNASAKGFRNSFRNSLSRTSLRHADSSSNRPATAPAAFPRPSMIAMTTSLSFGQTSESTKSYASALQVMPSRKGSTRSNLLRSTVTNVRLGLRETKQLKKLRVQQRQIFREKVAAKLIQRAYRLYLAKNFRLEQVLSRLDRHIEKRLFKVAEALRKELLDSFINQSKPLKSTKRKIASSSSSVASEPSVRSLVSGYTASTAQNSYRTRSKSSTTNHQSKLLKHMLAEPEYQKSVSIIDQDEHDRRLREKIQGFTIIHIDSCLRNLLKGDINQSHASDNSHQDTMMEAIHEAPDVEFFITSGSSDLSLPVARFTPPVSVSGGLDVTRFDDESNVIVNSLSEPTIIVTYRGNMVESSDLIENIEIIHELAVSFFEKVVLDAVGVMGVATEVTDTALACALKDLQEGSSIVDDELSRDATVTDFGLIETKEKPIVKKHKKKHVKGSHAKRVLEAVSRQSISSSVKVLKMFSNNSKMFDDIVVIKTRR